MIDLALALRVRYGLAMREKDPLAFWHHANNTYKIATASLADGLEVFVRAGNKAGKAQPLDEPVFTPLGWRPIGDVSVGDKVFCAEGVETRVTGVFPQGELPVFRVTFNDGTWTRCSADHLWEVKTHKQRFHGAPGFSVLSLSGIVKSCGEKPRPAYRPSVRRCAPLQIESAPVPLDPYLLGAIIGDGSFAKTAAKFTSCDEQIASIIEAATPEGCFFRKTLSCENRCPEYIFTSGSVGGDSRTRPRNKVLDFVRAMGLGGVGSHGKFVPAPYLMNSEFVRMSVLQGLMDTDGYVDALGRTDFCTVSIRLAKDVVWLVESLGGRAKITPKDVAYRGTTKPAFIVSLRMPSCPFRLDRKVLRWWVSGGAVRRTHSRTIATIEPDGVSECVCIKVEAESQTYLTRSLIVTHNSEWGSAAVVSMMQGRDTLDGEPLPRLPPRAIGAVLVLDHQQQVMSVQPAYLRQLGGWPHEVGWKSRANNIIGTIKIKPIGGSDDSRKWSILHFISQENPNATVGARLHVAHADEPPKEHIWNEVRARGHAGQPFIRLITATPLVRRQWAYLKKQFPEEHTGTPHLGRIELRVSVYDNAYLSERDKAELENLYSEDPLREARLHGDYIDVSGKCPFDPSTLAFLLQKCEPFRIKAFRVVRESDTAEGRTQRDEQVEVEVLEDRDPEEGYYIPLDASAGIDDAKHDPCCLHVWSRGVRGIPRLVARYNGYIGAYGLGVLAAELAKHYNHALVDPETSGGWGAPALSALANVGYGNVAKAKRELRPGEWAVELGFKTSESTRPAMIAAIQEWIRSERDRSPIATIRHGEVLRCLQDIVLNEKGKPIAAPGLHDEDMILAGQALRRLAVRRRAVIQTKPTSAWVYVPRGKTLKDFIGKRVVEQEPPREIIKLKLRDK